MKITLFASSGTELVSMINPIIIDDSDYFGILNPDHRYSGFRFKKSDIISRSKTEIVDRSGMKFVFAEYE